MSPERLRSWRVVGVTALVTFVVTLVGAAMVGTVVNRQSPATPQLAPPKTITVTLYPNSGLGLNGSGPTEIPAGEFGRVMRLVTPDRYYEGGVNDWIIPLIAEVVITHEDQPDSQLLVRWAGKNPATISVDGRHYYYGVPHEDIHDGGMQLVALVRRLAEAKTR